MFHKKITAKVVKVLTKKGAKAKKASAKKKTKETTQPAEPQSTLVAQVINEIPPTPQNYTFKVGSKFMLSNIIFTVKVRYEDSNVIQIKVYSLENGEEIYNLDSLKKDAAMDPSFTVIENG